MITQENERFFFELKEKWKNSISPHEKMDLVEKVIKCNVLDYFDDHYSAYLEFKDWHRRQLLKERNGIYKLMWHYCFRRLPLASLMVNRHKEKLYFKNGPWYYNFIKNRIEKIGSIKDNWEEIRWTMNRLYDVRSKQVFAGLLMARITGDNFYFDGVSDKGAIAQYYDLDVLHFEDGEVFVDCGAFDGDSAKDFIKVQHSNNIIYKRIYRKRIVSGRSPNKTGILARDARHASILL